jgi:hypothetical protein
MASVSALMADFVDARDIADRLLLGAADRQVVIGPVVWRPDADLASFWYFFFANRLQLFGHPRQKLGDAVRFREGLKRAVIIRSPSVVLHDCDCKLAMARRCKTLWPASRYAPLVVT